MVISLSYRDVIDQQYALKPRLTWQDLTSVLMRVLVRRTVRFATQDILRPADQEKSDYPTRTIALRIFKSSLAARVEMIACSDKGN